MQPRTNTILRAGLLALAALAAACSSSTQPPARTESVAFELPQIAPTEVRLVTYNVFLRPRPISIGDETACRAARIGSLLRGGEADIVALTETFRPDDVLTLSKEASQRFPHQILSQPAGSGFLGVSGGLSLLSRWPIESIRTHTYSDCSGPVSDCVANKGALHAVVRTSESERLNIVATHLDAGRWGSDRATRKTQLTELRAFIDEIDPTTGPVLMLGDFNIDALRDDGEYDEMLDTLSVDAYDVSGPSTVNCTTTIRCKKPSKPKRLDYIFSMEPDGRLHRGQTEHLSMEDGACGSRYLSDHRAVRATFDLTDTQTSPAP